MKRALALALLSTGCPEKSSADTRSTALATAAQRVGFLCERLLCPTTPEDAAFHVVVHDTSGFLAGPSDATVVAVVKVRPEDIPRWSMGCTPKRLEAKPAWLEGLLAERGWRPSTIPDTVLCGRERRVLHVKEGLVVREVSAD